MENFAFKNKTDVSFSEESNLTHILFFNYFLHPLSLLKKKALDLKCI